VARQQYALNYLIVHKYMSAPAPSVPAPNVPKSNTTAIIIVVVVLVIVLIGGVVFLMNKNGNSSSSASESTSPTTSPTTSQSTASPVDCVGSWSAPTSCSSCGGPGLTQKIKYIITTPASNGGVACSSTNGQTSSSVCNPAPPYCHGQSITFAGQDQGSTDGSGSAASFNNPTDVVIDSSNNLYVTDPLNSSIRKITPDGLVSTFKTISGHLPSNITIDLNGNFIIVDGNVIRRVTLAGAISTIAGGGMGSQDGNNTLASFTVPSATAIDSAGNIYVADTGNNVIRKITPQNMVSTYAGTTVGDTISYNLDGPASAARFANPVDVAVGPTGIVYVLCQYPPAIRAISADGSSVTTLAGSTEGYVDGTGAAAQFKGPTHMTIDPATGNIYVADTGNARIRMVTQLGVVTTYAGNSVPGRADGIGTSISFNNPMGLALDSSGNLFVVDSTNNIIRKIFK